MDSRSGHILDSSMVKSESYDTIKQSLEKIKAKFGTPLVVVSDLRPGFVRVCRDIFGKDVKHILCHYHFLRTFKEEFNEDHQFIENLYHPKMAAPVRLTLFDKEGGPPGAFFIVGQILQFSGGCKQAGSVA